jgi:hypothetical protein
MIQVLLANYPCSNQRRHPRSFARFLILRQQWHAAPQLATQMPGCLDEGCSRKTSRSSYLGGVSFQHALLPLEKTSALAGSTCRRNSHQKNIRGEIAVRWTAVVFRCQSIWPAMYHIFGLAQFSYIATCIAFGPIQDAMASITTMFRRPPWPRACCPSLQWK